MGPEFSHHEGLTPGFELIVVEGRGLMVGSCSGCGLEAWMAAAIGGEEMELGIAR